MSTKCYAIETAIIVASFGMIGGDTDAFISRFGLLATSMSSERLEAEFFHCNSPLKCPICYTGWSSKHKNFGFLILTVNFMQCA